MRKSPLFGRDAAMKNWIAGCALIVVTQGTSQALAASEPDCRLYTETHMQGESLDFVATDRAGSVPALTMPFDTRLGSLWMREGFALETYDAARFQGSFTTWAPAADDTRYHASEGGYYVNLSELPSIPRIASLRCRALGGDLLNLGISSYIRLHAYNGVRLDWRSGGNHPNHKWVEITAQGGRRTLVVHEDNTYGINASDYILDLDAGSIQVTLTRSPGLRREDIVPLPTRESSAAARLAYMGALWNMADAVRVIAEGNDVGYFVVPPKPELREVTQFLRSMIDNQQI